MLYMFLSDIINRTFVKFPSVFSRSSNLLDWLKGNSLKVYDIRCKLDKVLVM